MQINGNNKNNTKDCDLINFAYTLHCVGVSLSFQFDKSIWLTSHNAQRTSDATFWAAGRDDEQELELRYRIKFRDVYLSSAVI